PEADRFAYFDSLLKLSLLKLHANPLLQRVHVSPGIQSQNRDETPIRSTQTIDALHGRGLASPVRPDQAEYFSSMNVERDVVHGDSPAVRLADRSHVNDRLARHLCWETFCHARGPTTKNGSRSTETF